MEITKYTFPVHGDDRGKLIALEEYKEVPFSIKRIYYILDTTQGVIRGKHAHKKLQQVLLCIHGSCRVLLDNGHERQTVLLDRPDEGIYVSNAMWREMFDFSDDAVLLVLASDLYDEADYIRDYDAFIQYLKQPGKTDQGKEVQ